MIKLLIRYLPDSVLNEINAHSLIELDKRGLIVWGEQPQLEPENEYSAFNLADKFTCITSQNLEEVFSVIAYIYTNYGDCLALKYLMELLAEYFGLLKETKNV